MHTKEQVREATEKYFKGDQLATNVFFKYVLKDKQDNYHELTPDDMHWRLAEEFARVESNYPNPLVKQEIYELFKDFKYVVPQGSPMFGIGNPFQVSSLSNCVVVDSPKDTISSILDSGKDLANLFKRRAGVGIDISNLRPENALVNNAAGTTSGAWTFADFYSYVCRMIGQNGRRGALMISMDVKHPDIFQFVKMKHDLTKVTGANVSVKISDEFMDAVEKDGDFKLCFPVDSATPTYTKVIKAKDLWKEIVSSATKTAEPGILMWDNILKNLPANEYRQFRTICVNPCAEIALSAYDSCRLISVNLKHFVKNFFTKDSYFDFTHFEQVVRKAMRLSDDLVDLEIEKLNQIIALCDTEDEKVLWKKLKNACEAGRRTGLGTHGLADAIARLNLRYDSPQALVIIENIYETLRNAAYSMSINLAKERGAFSVFNWEFEKNNAFIMRLPVEIRIELKKHGRRNISILTNAPTGSVSIESQTSSGIEPVFKNSHIRRRKLDQNELNTKADFVDEMGDRWIEFKVFHHNAKEYLDMFGLTENDALPDFFVESDNINWTNRIKIQGTIQRYIDHAISSTINLPKGTSEEVVAELYLQGWKQGLKGITVYVDGSRDGVLVTESKKDSEEFVTHDAPKRKKLMPCDVHHVTVKGQKFAMFVGLFNGKPFEIFGGLNDQLKVPKDIDSGYIEKNASRDYTFEGVNADTEESVTVDNLADFADNTHYSDLTRMVSLALRHGANVKYVVEQLSKNESTDMTSFNKVISRVLKTYIKQGEVVTGSSCPECKEKLVYQDGCAGCINPACGYSKCK